MAQGLVVTSVPLGGISGIQQVPLTLQTSAGPALTVRSTPLGAIAGLMWTAPVTDITAVSTPLGGVGGLIQLPLSFSFPQLPVARPLRTWQRDTQRFAVTQERQRHVQALWQYGELMVFALLWTSLDAAAGLAQPCTRCNVNAQATSPEGQIASAYGQGSQFRCTLCFGSQFIAAATVASRPGLRALLVRPALLTDLDRSQQFTARGVMNPGQLNAESTPDFRVRNGDYMFRVTGDRFRLRTPRRVTLRTGFASPWQASSAINYNQASAALEDPTSVAYIIPPGAPALARWLGTYTRVPVSYAGLEIINGPLIPLEEPSAASSDELQQNASFPLPVT